MASVLDAQSLAIKDASVTAIAPPTLQLALAIDLGPRATEALESGLMLAYTVEWQLADGRRLQQSLSLRYSPLLRSYQLAIGSTPTQAFTLRNSLLAAMENARVRWPDAPECAGACGGRVRVRLDPAALPAPLRLPALVDSDWDFDSGWHAVTAGPQHEAQETGHGARSTGEGLTEANSMLCTISSPGSSRAPCPVPPAPGTAPHSPPGKVGPP